MLLTTETAKELAAKSAQVRAQRSLELARLRSTAKEAQEVADLLSAQREAQREYAASRLMRVRAQLNTLDQKMEDELARKTTDSRTIKEIADAQLRLSEQERILAGRPLPGSCRPRAEKQTRAKSQFEPVEAAPEGETAGQDS